MTEINQVILDSITYAENEVNSKGDFYINGYNSGLSIIKMTVSNMESTSSIPLIIKKCYEAFNGSEDLIDENGDVNKIAYLKGQYDSYQNFMNKFNKWLKNQEFETIAKHSVNEYIYRNQKIDKDIDAETRLMVAITTHYLTGYKLDDSGRIESLKVRRGEEGESKNVPVETFKSIFEFDHLNADDIEKV